MTCTMEKTNNGSKELNFLILGSYKDRDGIWPGF